MLPDPAVLAGIDAASLADQYQEWLLKTLVFLVTVLVVYLVGRFVVVPPLVRVVDARNPNNPTIVDATGLYLRVVFVIVALPVAIAAAGFGGVAAGSGIVIAAATLALGVAGRDVIGNFVSGVFLVADPDFNVGNYIEWGDSSGTVEAIDLRVTRVRTPGGETVIVPNTELTTGAVTRPFARDRYRLTQRLTVAYGEDLDAVADALVAVAAADDRVMADPEPVVHVTDLGGSAVELSAWFWVDDPTSVDLADVRTGFATRATDRLLAAGVAVAPANPQDLSGGIDIRIDDPADA